MTNYPGDPGHSTSPLSYEVGWGGGGGLLKGLTQQKGLRTKLGAKLRERKRVYRHVGGMEKGKRLVLPSCP